MKNVFQLWLENIKILPFKVKRFSWHPSTYFVVKRIEANWDYYNKTGNLYGKAYGDIYLRAKLTKQDTILECAGCYQWEIIP
jgi:hypothetical protein